MYLLAYEGTGLGKGQKQVMEWSFLLCSKDGHTECHSLHDSSGKAPASSRVIWEFLC